MKELNEPYKCLTQFAWTTERWGIVQIVLRSPHCLVSTVTPSSLKRISEVFNMERTYPHNINSEWKIIYCQFIRKKIQDVATTQMLYVLLWNWPLQPKAILLANAQRRGFIFLFHRGIRNIRQGTCPCRIWRTSIEIRHTTRLFLPFTSESFTVKGGVK